MSSQEIGFLMDDSLRDLQSARRFRDEGVYAKSINDSYYAVFYAAKAALLHLGVRSKDHRGVRMAINQVVADGGLPPGMEEVPGLLSGMRSQAVYRYARRDWSEGDATDALTLAEGFVGTVRKLITT